MIHHAVAMMALVWVAGLLAACVFLVVRARSSLGRLLALDTVALVVVGVLILYALAERNALILDAALALALLSFAATVAAARYHVRGGGS